MKFNFLQLNLKKSQMSHSKQTTIKKIGIFGSLKDLRVKRTRFGYVLSLKAV